MPSPAACHGSPSAASTGMISRLASVVRPAASFLAASHQNLHPDSILILHGLVVVAEEEFNLGTQGACGIQGLEFAIE